MAANKRVIKLVDLKENAASAYRRGSVLGFTIGEVFILLSFILLLILLLKQAEVFEKQEQVNDLDEQLTYATLRLTQTEDTLQVVQARLLEAERRLEEAQVKNEQLASSVAAWTEFTAAEREKTQELIASGELYSATAIASALEDMTYAELGNVIDQATRPGRQELLNALTDVSDEAMLNLAKAFEAVESPEDLASNVGEFGGVDPFTLTRGVTIARSIQELDPRVSEEDVLDAIEVGTTINDKLSGSDWQRLETLLEATGWSTRALEEAVQQTISFDPQTSPDPKDGGNNWPPIISLSEAKDYSFNVGSATLAPRFKDAITGPIAEQILKILVDYDADVIEVIGHTDPQPMRDDRVTNLDNNSVAFLHSQGEISLRAKDNAGLGYARALSVTKELMKVPSLKGYTILPYSAAQMITPNEELQSGLNRFDGKQLRRIEIRVRRKQ